MSYFSANPNFQDGLTRWYAYNGGTIRLEKDLLSSPFIKSDFPHYVVVSGRGESWHGLGQDIQFDMKSGRGTFHVNAFVSIRGDNVGQVMATLCINCPSRNSRWIRLGSITASNQKFSLLVGSFSGLELPESPSKITAYLEGPPPGVELLVASFQISFEPSPDLEQESETLKNGNVAFNGDFRSGTANWTGMAGSEVLVPVPSSPYGSPLGPPEPFVGFCINSTDCQLAGPTGPYLKVQNRTQTWQGPKQCVGWRIVPYCTYGVSAWVRVNKSDSREEVRANTQMTLRVFKTQRENGQKVPEYMILGAINASSKKWSCLMGSFRLETDSNCSYSLKESDDAIVYFEGPPAGVDLWIANVRIVEQTEEMRRERIEMQKVKAKKTKGGQWVVKVINSSGKPLEGVNIKIKQRKSLFPLGTCVCAQGLELEEYRKFVEEKFNFVVMENELKWAYVEQVKGLSKFDDADRILKWASEKGLKVRGHCLVWDGELPKWTEELNDKDFAQALDERVEIVTKKYKGKFVHYDINNEMLHSENIPKRLGMGAVVRLFQKAHLIDPDALLFVNDYHIEDGKDSRSTPDVYRDHVRELIECGAPVHGIGIQGHIFAPVGWIVEAAFDKLSSLGIPIWVTELDVESKAEKIRANDLEVMLWEAFSHPRVDGVLLWGFLEGMMFRKDGFLVRKDWSLSEAGKRLNAVLKEWSNGKYLGETDGNGEFSFEGFSGLYDGVVETKEGEEIDFELTIEPGSKGKSCTIIVK